MDPQPWPEGSYELGCHFVLPSVCHFFPKSSWDWVFRFSWNFFYSVKAHLGMCVIQYYHYLFFEKLLVSNITKLVKNNPKMGGFGHFKKIYQLILSENGIEWKYLRPFNILQKLLSANQISVFFNCQYLINGVTSDCDFLDRDRHEWSQQRLLIGFVKLFILGQRGHFCLRTEWL